MNILVVMYKDVTGCQYYRQYSPHVNLAKNYKDVKITFAEGTGSVPDAKLKEYDLIQWHKGYISANQLDRIKRLGIPQVGDYDDYWELGRDHVLWYEYHYDKEGNKRARTYTEQLRSYLPVFDAVTVTTDLLADAVRPFNKNVHVLENGVFFDREFTVNTNGKEMRPFDQYFPNPQNGDDFVRVGWVGGSTHLNDLRLMEGAVNTLPHSDVKDQYKFVLVGYHSGSIFDNYCDILTNHGRFKKQFATIPMTSVYNYCRFYNFLDVVLVPLVGNKFNQYKSELKLIEAGWFKKPVVVSGVNPYLPLLKHGENCLVANKYGDWHKHIRALIKSPELREKLGNALHETVKVRFNQDNISEQRYKVYKQCLTATQLSERAAVLSAG